MESSLAEEKEESYSCTCYVTSVRVWVSFLREKKERDPEKSARREADVWHLDQIG